MAASRRVRSGAIGVAGVVAVGALAGCGSGNARPVAPTTRAAAPVSAAGLRDGLLPTRLPHGWTVQEAAVNPAPGSPAGVTPPQGCQLVIGEDVVDDSATTAGASASARFAKGHGASGTETLYAFGGQGARTAVAAIRSLASRCAKQVSTDGTTTRFSVTKGPALGDDSLVVRAEQTYSAEPGVVRYADADVVRVGPFLLTLSTFPVSRADGAAVASLLPLAVKQLKRAMKPKAQITVR